MSMCPDCGDDLMPNANRCKCGWRVKVTSISAGRGSAERDSESWRCCHVDRGQRCANPGSISPSMSGKGPWFCAQHYTRGGSSTKQGPVGGFQPLRDIVGAAAKSNDWCGTFAPDDEAANERAAIQKENE
jgi:hypothetical protein